MAHLIQCPYCETFNFRPYASRIREQAPHYLRVVCRECGLIFANPQATPEELNNYYQQYYDKGNFQGWKESVQGWKASLDVGEHPHEHREIIRVATRIFEAISRYRQIKGERLKWLEIGGGLGELTYLAKINGYETTATDLDEDAIFFMQTIMGIEHTYLGDVRNLPEQDCTYDIIVIHHVLEHVSDLFATLHAIHRLLKPGGIIFVGVPNMGSIGYQLNRALSFLTFQIPDIVEGIEHTFGFTRKTLNNCLQKANFEVKSIRAFGKGDQIKPLMAFIRQKGIRKLMVSIAENSFHTKMECIAIKN